MGARCRDPQPQPGLRASAISLIQGSLTPKATHRVKGVYEERLRLLQDLMLTDLGQCYGRGIGTRVERSLPMLQGGVALLQRILFCFTCCQTQLRMDVLLKAAHQAGCMSAPVHFSLGHFDILQLSKY